MKIIVAMTKQRVIGNGLKIPWHYSEDFKHFKEQTKNSTVIMGRKTYQSIGKPLPNRENIVVSSKLQEQEGIQIASSLNDAIKKASKKEIFVIGGQRLYEEALPKADELIISHIHEEFEGDVFFPEFNKEDFLPKRVEVKKDFTIVWYEKNSLKQTDNEIYETIKLEETRQKQGIELIPSENIVSQAVLKAMGSVLTNKYSEGYPNKRYYGGNEFIDVSEQLAIDRAKELFNADHANVQPHSGANANMAVFLALLKPGDKVLGLKLDHGGHLTHGHPVNISGQFYDFVQYNVDEQGFLDYKEIEEIALKEKPKLIIAGFSAYSREIDFKKFKEIADKTNSLLMADVAHIAGLIVAGLHQSPFPHCDVVTTTTHKTLRGPRGGLILCKEEHKKAINKAVFPGLQGGPLEHIIAAKAVAFKEALKPEFKEYQKQILKNSKALAAELMKRDIKIVSGGTDNHLMLIDLREEKIKGKELELLLDEIGIYANKNTVPYDPASPFKPSGLRIGTPVVTTRGMKEKEMEFIAKIIAKAIKTPESINKEETRMEVISFCEEFRV